MRKCNESVPYYCRKGDSGYPPKKSTVSGCFPDKREFQIKRFQINRFQTRQRLLRSYSRYPLVAELSFLVIE